MQFQFSKHYTLEEARALLPQIRGWFQTLDSLRANLGETEQHLNGMLDNGQDAGGGTVEGYVRKLAEIKSILNGFEKRHVFIKDLDRGLVDFPSLKGGREVFLCWEKDDEDIEFWHDLDSGYSGRERF